MCSCIDRKRFSCTWCVSWPAVEGCELRSLPWRGVAIVETYAGAALSASGAVMVAQWADDDVVLVADGERARKRCCARRRHSCKHARPKLLGEAKIAHEALGRRGAALEAGRAACSLLQRSGQGAVEQLRLVEEALS